MSETTMWILKALGLILVTIGALIVFLAPRIVDRFKLVEKTQLSEDQMKLPVPDQQKIKRHAAILSVKIKGLFVALPGCIIVLILFR